MKNLLKYAIASLLVLAATTGFSQTLVTGHVFAEVVESVSASQQSKSSFSFQRNSSDVIDLGQIEITSASSATCSLILGKANLTDNNQNRISLETSAHSTQAMQGNAINGYQSISLHCQPDGSMLDQRASQYQGDINIVLAYN
ncbi:MAG: hypothetical protein WCI92_10680 [Bacteroidota bacterium]